MGLRAGFASHPVTPPVPGPMGGYAAREGLSEGVHDDLWVRAVVLESDGVKAAILVADVLAAPRSLVDEVRREAAPPLGVPESHLVVAATHTHSGPAIPPFLPQPDEAYLSQLGQAMAGTIARADSQLTPATVGWATAPAEGVGGNRREPSIPADPAVRGLVVWGETGGTSGILLNHACHPTVLGPSNRMISADFPGAALEILRQGVGDDVWVAYAQGPAGDISCRFTRRGQTFDEVRRLGSIVAEAGQKVAAEAEPLHAEPLLVRSRSVSLPRRTFPPRNETASRLEEAQARADKLARSEADPGRLRLAQSLVEGYTVELQLGEQLDLLETEAEVTAIGLGDVALVAMPGELFTSVGQAIRERSPFAATMVLGYAGGYIGYVPDREAYQSGGYESLVSWLEPDAAELLVDTASGLLSDLNEGRT